MGQTIGPFQSGHRREEFLGFLRGIPHVKFRLAVVAMVAVSCMGLTEILQERLTTARKRIREVLHPAQFLQQGI